MARRDAFTLIELIVVVAIVAAVSAILLPVFVQVKAQAKAGVCLSNFRQVAMSSIVYSMDYDDRYVLSRYTHRLDATSADDRTWVQLVLPYNREFNTFKCPSDHTLRYESRAVFDEDLVPGDMYSRYYTASKHVNVGFNYMYLSPLILEGPMISPLSRMQTEVSDPANMLMFGDSVFEVTEEGFPKGGGSYLVLPPCRNAIDGRRRLDTFRLGGFPDAAFFVGNLKWASNKGKGKKKEKVPSGGLWPWHGEELTVIFADGHATRLTLEEATDGCDVQPKWAGAVRDRGRYLWDLD